MNNKKLNLDMGTPEELKALREGITVKEVNTLADSLPTAKEAGETMRKALNPEGYQVAEVSRVLIEGYNNTVNINKYGKADQGVTDKLARDITPKLKALFNTTFDQAAQDCLQSQLDDALKRISEMQDAGVEMQRKLSEALDTKGKEKHAREVDLNRLTESEANLEQALLANKDLHTALRKYDQRVDKLLNITESLAAKADLL